MTRLEAFLAAVSSVVFRIPQGEHRTGAPYRPGPDDAPTVSFARLAHPYKQETTR